MRKKILLIGALITSLTILTGCRTSRKYEDYKLAYAQGQYMESVNVFNDDMEDRIDDAGSGKDGRPNTVPGSRDYSLDDMEIGSGYRAAQEFSTSTKAFERAEQGIRDQQEASLAGDTALQVSAVFTNDNYLPYQVQAYDSIMVNTYKAMNLLQEGEIDKARVEFRRVEERQRMAVEEFKKQIAKEREDERRSHNSKNTANSQASDEGGLKGVVYSLIAEKFDEAKDVVTGAIREGDNRRKMDEYEQTFSADTWGAQEAFSNPFASFMQGLFLLLYGEDQSDAEAAVFAFTRAFRKENNPVRNPPAQALVLATEVANNRRQTANLNNKVFVIFENGLGPELQEYTLPIVIPMRFNSGVMIVDASLVLPKLVKRNEAFPYISVCNNGMELAKTISVCNMDAVVASEFRERMPRILLRNVIQSGIKSVLQVLIVKALEDQGVPTILSSPVIAAVFHFTKAADLRIWSSLPKNFQVAIVDRPASGILQFMVPGAPAPIGTANIPAGSAAIVFVHTPSPQVPLTINVISTVTKKY